MIVYSVRDGFEISEDGTKRPVRFSIQDVPNEEGRRQEIYDHMDKYWIEDEPFNRYMKVKEHPDAVMQYHKRWDFTMDQGATIGCYKLDSEGKIGELVGVNIVAVINTHWYSSEPKCESKTYNGVRDLVRKFSVPVPVYSLYEADKFFSFDLSVARSFRGQNLGYHMIEAVIRMGKTYGIPLAYVIFSSEASQRQGERAGFKVYYSCKYDDVKDDHGNPMFPNFGAKTCVTAIRQIK